LASVLLLYSIFYPTYTDVQAIPPIVLAGWALWVAIVTVVGAVALGVTTVISGEMVQPSLPTKDTKLDGPPKPIVVGDTEDLTTRIHVDAGTSGEGSKLIYQLLKDRQLTELGPYEKNLAGNIRSTTINIKIEVIADKVGDIRFDVDYEFFASNDEKWWVTTEEKPFTVGIGTAWGEKITIEKPMKYGYYLKGNPEVVKHGETVKGHFTIENLSKDSSLFLRELDCFSPSAGIIIFQSLDKKPIEIPPLKTVEYGPCGDTAKPEHSFPKNTKRTLTWYPSIFMETTTYTDSSIILQKYDVSHSYLIGMTGNCTSDIFIEPICGVNGTKGNTFGFELVDTSAFDTFFWDFGDGITLEAGPSVSHIFEQSGYYQIAATNLETDTTIDGFVEIVNSFPEITLADVQSIVLTNTPVNFNFELSDPDELDSMDYTINYGDGTVDSGNLAETNSYSLQPAYAQTNSYNLQHIYDKPDTYFYSISVNDNDGGFDKKSGRIIVKDGPPAVDLSLPSTAQMNENIYFEAMLLDEIPSFINDAVWSFGDGTYSGGYTASHSYEEPGNYDVVFEITDNLGTTSSSQQIQIEPAEPRILETGWEVRDFDLKIGTNVARSSGDLTYHWNFGDGTSGNGRIVEHTFANDATYDVVLQVTNQYDKSATESYQIEIAPGLEYEFDPKSTPGEISIPDWVRNNAGWWSDGSITDNDFASGLEFMIKENIIKVPTTSNGQSTENAIIPDWVRNNAGWWSEGLISDKDFANGIQYLIQQGIISV